MWLSGFCRNFLHNGSGAVHADFASRIIDAALGEGKLTAATAGFGIEFMKSGGALFGSKAFGVDAGKHGGAVSVLQENFSGVLEGFDSSVNGEIQKRADFGLIKSRIK